MGQRHWKILRTIVLFAILPIGSIRPAAAQSQNPVDLNQAEGGKALVRLTRTQQAYFLENNEFSKTLPALNTEIPNFRAASDSAPTSNRSKSPTDLCTGNDRMDIKLDLHTRRIRG
jgi:hypothetical protein